MTLCSTAMSTVPDAGGLDDAALLRGVAAGDRRCLATLYDRFSPIMLAVGLRLLGNRGEAEDLVHDVFIEAWRRAHSYDPNRGSVRTWLLLRMRSRCLDRKKSAAVSRREAMPDYEAAAPGGAFGDELGRHVDRQRIAAALGSLSESQREVVLLGYFGGLSAREIGERVGIPTGTAKSRLAAALRQLRGELTNQSAQDGGPT